MAGSPPDGVTDSERNRLQTIPEGIPAAGRNLRARGRATMLRLMDAGLDVLAEQGWHDARIDDVAERAGTSHGTFYLYFSSKEDLLRMLALDCAGEARALVAALPVVEPGPQGEVDLAEWLGRYFDFHRDFFGVIRGWMEQQLDHPELAELRDEIMGSVVAEFIDRIARSTGVEPSEATSQAIVLLALVERFGYYVNSRGLGLDRDIVVETTARLVHRGFFSGGRERSLEVA